MYNFVRNSQISNKVIFFNHVTYTREREKKKKTGQPHTHRESER